MTSLPAVQRFRASTGARIYRIPMIVFPNGFTGYSFVVLDAGQPTLIDTGSGLGDSNQHLLDGFETLRGEFGEKLRPSDIRHILVTHGHIDHFGGVAFMVEQTGAQVGIHELDRRVLTAYEERVIMATRDLRIYLEGAGVEESRRALMIEMYGFGKKHLRSVAVDFSLDEGALFEGMRFIHTPGHCPGQVCILLGDVMISADHILSHTTPHQAPESITHYTGLGHYLDALRKVEAIDGIELALGGHEDPIQDVYGRIQQIRHSHERKLNRVLDLIRDAGRPCTINEITQKMYPDVDGYEILLALEEAGAHVEYLYQHGQLSVANLDEIEQQENPALYYTVTT
jgi:glyoxylase-like metal-dependent hydrolase (beta-lactamase superfamily II)